MVPRLRVWRCPTWSSASCMIGQWVRTASENSRSRWRVIAPISSALPVLADVGQALHPIEIDNMIGQHEAHVEHGHQRLPAGQQLCIFQAAEEADGFADGLRIVVAEGRRLHCCCIRTGLCAFFTCTNRYASIQKNQSRDWSRVGKGAGDTADTSKAADGAVPTRRQGRQPAAQIGGHEECRAGDSSGAARLCPPYATAGSEAK